MKKILCVLLSFVILLSLVSCKDQPDNEKIRVGALSGPTGMGMAKLIADSPEGYTFDIFGSPDAAVASFAAGEVDFLCLPSNVAAQLAIKKSDYLTVLAVNCTGSLFLLSDGTTDVSSLSDLDGKTVYSSVPGSTTGPILDYLFEKAGVTVTVETEADHDALVARLAKSEVEIAVLPEPKVSAALLGAAGGYRVALDLSDEWRKVSESPLAMGVLVVRNGFLKNHPGRVEDFLSAYRLSVAYICDTQNAESAAAMIVDAGILPKLPIAKSALSRLSGAIVCIEGEEMKTSLKAFYNAIGQTVPDDSFFYRESGEKS